MKRSTVVKKKKGEKGKEKPNSECKGGGITPSISAAWKRRGRRRDELTLSKFRVGKKGGAPYHSLPREGAQKANKTSKLKGRNLYCDGRGGKKQRRLGVCSGRRGGGEIKGFYSKKRRRGGGLYSYYVYGGGVQ